MRIKVYSKGAPVCEGDGSGGSGRTRDYRMHQGRDSCRFLIQKKGGGEKHEYL